MKSRLLGIACAIALASCSAAWAASTFSIDQLSVTLNGTAIFTDEFNDGAAPPSSPTYLINAITPGYNVFGNYPAGSEAAGLLTMSIANGLPTTTATGRPAILQSSRLLTPINPASPLALGSNDTFKVSSTFNYVNPDGPTEAFRLSVNDRVMPQGPGDTTNDTKGWSSSARSLAVLRQAK